MTAPRPRRSALFLPASNARAIEKAKTLACDVAILDLEDAVGSESKVEARAQAVAAVRAGGFSSREVVIRVNGLDTPWGVDDLRAVAHAGVDAVMVPKVSSLRDMAAYAAALHGSVRIWAMIETCQAVLRLDALGSAAAANRLDVWVVGTNDLAKEMRCRSGVNRAPLFPALTSAVIAARAHGLTILDGVYNDFADAEGFATECAQGTDLGFDGKSLIHPTQIEAANCAFSPKPEAIAWARTVAAAFDAPENAGKGVIQVEGRMVELLHLAEAERLIAVADAIVAHEAVAG